MLPRAQTISHLSFVIFHLSSVNSTVRGLAGADQGHAVIKALKMVDSSYVEQLFAPEERDVYSVVQCLESQLRQERHLPETIHPLVLIALLRSSDF